MTLPSPHPHLSLIVAHSENHIIGLEGDLPWVLRDDLLHFMRSTKGHPVIMGRKTYETLPSPLPDRLNIVVSRTMDEGDERIRVARSLDDAITIAEGAGLEYPIWLAGGGALYREGLDRCSSIVRTVVHTHVEGDTSFPEIDESEWECIRSRTADADDRNQFGFTIHWLRRIVS